jgi:hypothetical protein
MLVAAVVQTVRLARWAGDRTLRDRLVLILHVGYAFVPLGFLIIGGAILFPGTVPISGGVHVWTVGAIGTMMLAIMTRASLGHTGQPLSAGRLPHAGGLWDHDQNPGEESQAKALPMRSPRRGTEGAFLSTGFARAAEKRRPRRLIFGRGISCRTSATFSPSVG